MDKQRRSFEFRMSKKVAELTQVVHMLFTRNHEKEVEIEALKDAYELEISDVIHDAEKKLHRLTSELEEVKTRLGTEGDRVRLMLEDEYKIREAELSRKLADTELLLSNERQECQNIRDLLINAQKDIEHLRQGVAEQLYLKSDQISKRDKDIERLRKQVAQLERLMRDSDKEVSSTVRDYEKNNERLEGELTHVHELLEESQRMKEQHMYKVKSLEAELKMLKKDFNRRVAEVVATQASKTPRSAPTFMNYAPEMSGVVGKLRMWELRMSKKVAEVTEVVHMVFFKNNQNHNEELEHLRREVQRYRMELSNRDSNFNRVFSSQQPMIVDHRSRSMSCHSQPPLPPKALTRGATSVSNGHMQNSIGGSVLVNGFTKTSSRQGKRASVPQLPTKSNVSNNIYSYYEEFANSARPNSASSQLPSISSTATSSDGRQRSQGLSKPRPLPKEMLFTR